MEGAKLAGSTTPGAGEGLDGEGYPDERRGRREVPAPRFREDRGTTIPFSLGMALVTLGVV